METGSGLGPDSESGGSSAESSLGGGLKFGQKIYFEDSCGGGGSGSSGPGSSSGSGRKTRGAGPGQAGQPPRCQVEGCRVDLSNVKAYYSRHKVCAMHSKSPTVIVAGLEQRFCQQCSRFHQLPEFDQEKRSCRRRLAGHNERRRKPQHSSLLTSRYGRISPSLLGNASTVTSGNFLVDSTAWPPARASDVSSIRRPLSSSPWQIHPENHPLNIFPQVSVSGGTRFSCPEMMNPRAESYKGVADSSCALSLLSNQQQAPPLSPTWRASSGFNVMTLGQVSIAQPGPEFSRHQYSNPAWEFKSGDSISSSSHDMSPVLGLGQISEAANSQIGGSAAMGELTQNQQTRRLYMEPENSRAYDYSSQNINWPL